MKILLRKGSGVAFHTHRELKIPDWTEIYILRKSFRNDFLLSFFFLQFRCSTYTIRITMRSNRTTINTFIRIMPTHKIDDRASGTNQHSGRSTFQNLNNFSVSNRPPLLRSPSPGILDAVSNVVEFVKDGRTYRGRRSYLHSRYPKGTSSASTSPDWDRYAKERHRSDRAPNDYYIRTYTPRSRLSRKGTTSSSSCYTYDSCQNRRSQPNYESYDYDTNVLTGKSRSPSPSQRNGNQITAIRRCSAVHLSFHICRSST